MKVAYEPAKVKKIFTPIALTVNIESEEELADLYIRLNIILTDEIIQAHQPEGFDGVADEDTTSDNLFDALSNIWENWRRA